jgi:predicted  nucleic acid-binding Zn-ribbon protein
LRYEIEIQTHVYIDNFYLKGDRVTVEIEKINNRGQQTDKYIESLSNLTDDEVFTIVEDMILRGGNGYY